MQRAIAIWIIDNVHGPVTAVSGRLTSTPSGTIRNSTNSDATLTIFEQRILVDGFTRFGAQLQNMLSSATNSTVTLQTGTVAEVSGIADGRGALLATLLDTRSTATEYHVRGIVSGVTGSPVMNFTVTPVPDGTPLTVSLASGATTTAKITDGMTVNVIVDAATFNPGSTSIAARVVDPVFEPIPAENDLVNMEGFISDLSGNTFTMNGMDVRAGTLPAAGLDTGRVRVRGTMSGGTIRATSVGVR
ncbi:MAG: hypothetical protein A2078_05965 [Nitrospirae bacterium GWC2_57_9]|nr:MAG: hypothetical protein A2078_05965 [Nitrospirae bacterium GWC2_57_9]